MHYKTPVLLRKYFDPLLSPNLQIGRLRPAINLFCLVMKFLPPCSDLERKRFQPMKATAEFVA